MPDQTVPPDFTLEGEQARQNDAAQGGITARESVPELNGPHPVPGVDGAAHDDHEIEDHDDPTPIGDDV